jgi:SAM-dependent methyltransferase
MAMNDGERQVAPTVDGIRCDHVARYEWAAKLVKGRVIDLACGVGYGTAILAAAGCKAIGFDRASEAIGYARKHYAGTGAEFTCAEAIQIDKGKADAVVCFETVEHLEEPAPVLMNLRAIAPLLLVSVPNEDVVPHDGRAKFHFRHYTKGQFHALLSTTGWAVKEWWGQAGIESDVELDVAGRTLIAVCERMEIPQKLAPSPINVAPPQPDRPVPEHVAILALGPSLEKYVDVVKRVGGKHAYCDETWGINAVGGVVLCDRIFHMDDVRIQEIRAKARPDTNIARMLEWIKVHPGPIITSRAHPDYPGLVEYPLRDVIHTFQHAYFNSTVAYAVAYAIWLGVKKISLYGLDFTYANSHDAEKGRACVEFWLGIAAERGINFMIPKDSTLLDAMNTQAERLYGYDTVDVRISAVKGDTVVEFTERAQLPTADEIEDRYDHGRHTNALVEQSLAAAGEG